MAFRKFLPSTNFSFESRGLLTFFSHWNSCFNQKLLESSKNDPRSYSRNSHAHDLPSDNLTACYRRTFSSHQLTHACEQLKTVWRYGNGFRSVPLSSVSLPLAREDFRLRPPALLSRIICAVSAAPTTGRRDAAHTFLFGERLFVYGRKKATNFYVSRYSLINSRMQYQLNPSVNLIVSRIHRELFQCWKYLALHSMWILAIWFFENSLFYVQNIGMWCGHCP